MSKVSWNQGKFQLAESEVMHKQKSILGFWSSVGLLTAMAVCSVEQPAQGASLTSWRFDPATNQLEITLNQRTVPRYFLVSQPPRIVIDLPNTKLGRIPRQKNYSGSVRQIRVVQLQAGVTRIVLELSPQVVLAPEQVELILSPASSGNRWVLRPRIGETPAYSATVAPTLPTTLPPATFTTPQTPVVQVPPLNLTQGLTPRELAPATLPTMLPPAIFPSNQTPSMAPAPTTSSVIEFGQPLPNTVATLQSTLPPLKRGADLLRATPATPRTTATLPVVEPALNQPPITADGRVVMQDRDRQTDDNFSMQAQISDRIALLPEGILPAGTLINLSYPGENNLNLQAGTPRQEVLLLQEEIRDRTGKIIVPSGTPIIGRFETGSSGSRFITQTMLLGRRNFRLVAQSGIMGAAAAQPTTIEPGQILQVQLTEDWRYIRN